MANIETECGPCGGTGLYVGFAEPKGTAVVCLNCLGSGRYWLPYKPFTERKARSGIKFVARSQGSFIGTGVGPIGQKITYEEFLKGKMP